MADKEDRRVKKTKRLLREGLAVLLQQKSVNHITVRELAEYADINRATFYAHYKDVYDLLEQTEQDVFENIRTSLTTYMASNEAHNVQAFFHTLLEYVAGNAELGRALLGRYGGAAFSNSLQQLLGEFFTKYWNIHEFSPWSHGFTFIMSGCIGLIQQWLADGLPEPPDELAKIMSSLVENAIRQLTPQRP